MSLVRCALASIAVLICVPAGAIESSESKTNVSSEVRTAERANAFDSEDCDLLKRAIARRICHVRPDYGDVDVD
jgi:hypothetical protein